MGSCKYVHRTPWEARDEVGCRLRRLREAADIEMDELSEHVGVSVQHIRMIERGRSGSSCHVVAKLAEPFMEPDELRRWLLDVYGPAGVS